MTNFVNIYLGNCSHLHQDSSQQQRDAEEHISHLQALGAYETNRLNRLKAEVTGKLMEHNRLMSPRGLVSPRKPKNRANPRQRKAKQRKHELTPEQQDTREHELTPEQQDICVRAMERWLVEEDLRMSGFGDSPEE